VINISPSGGDDTASIQTALNSGDHVCLDVGEFNISNALTINHAGQILSGNGRAATQINVGSGFVHSQGVIIFASGEEGPQLQNFGIYFSQPDTNVRTNLINYPVAIYAQNTARFTITNMKITNATNGIDMRGNCGGAFINLLEMSAYQTGIQIDGSMDTVRLNQFHFWNFDMTSNQASIFYSQGTKALDIGRVDGLFIDEFLNISNLGMNIYEGATGAPWIYMSNSGFDTFNGIQMSAGSLQAVNSYITMEGGNPLQGVLQTGGFLQFSNCYFASAQSQPFMLLENMTGGSLQIDNSYFNFNNGTQISVGGNMAIDSIQVNNCRFEAQSANFQLIGVAASSNPNNIHCTNNVMQTQPNITYKNPIINILSGNRAYLSGNRVLDKGTGSSTFIAIAQDNFNWVSGNIAPGWNYSFPSTGKTGFYANNL